MNKEKATWKERIEDALKVDIEPFNIFEHNVELTRVIREFRDILKKKPFMYAELFSKPHKFIPQIWSLHTGPRFRPNKENIMLSFAVYPDFVRILGAEEEYHKPDELQEALTLFATTSYFPSTVLTYASLYNEDAIGSLQFQQSNGPTTKDVIVSVSAVEHNNVASKSENGGEIYDFPVCILPTEGFPDFDKDAKYNFLQTEGYFVKIERINVIEAIGVLQIRGAILPTPQRENLIL